MILLNIILKIDMRSHVQEVIINQRIAPDLIKVVFLILKDQMVTQRVEI